MFRQAVMSAGLRRRAQLGTAVVGIRVNSTLPGLILTKRADAYGEETRRVIAKSLAGRLGTSEDIGHAVLFLSLPASSLDTGASLPVDGGFTITAF
jgi:NAD(P)-dependent dehydrogenase (short-subunit alcohol dehydrogenase family)